MYDTVITHLLEWPSLTIQWLPTIESPSDSDFTRHKLLLGTQTTGEEPNYLMIAKVKLPKHEVIKDTSDFKMVKKDENDKNPNNNSVQIETRILHEGEVNKASYMPQKYNIIATKANNGDVLIFDYTKHPSKPPVNDRVNYQLKLTGHEDLGYGLSWNPKKEGYLLSGSDDNKICIWDINEAKEFGGEMKPKSKFTYHTKPVNDVQWHCFNQNMFGSVSEDMTIGL